MEKELKKLMEEQKIMEETIFEDAKEERAYAHKLSEKMQKLETEILEQKRKYDDMLWELRHAESKVFDYYLGIK